MTPILTGREMECTITSRFRPASLLVPSAALLWASQFAFLNPALAVLLSALFDASAAEIGVALVLFNASTFVSQLVIPSWADRRRDYLTPLAACGLLTIAVLVGLWLAPSLPVSVAVLVVVGGPSCVGVTLLYAHIHASGASVESMMRIRALMSFAWIAGPPAATFVLGAFGASGLLVTVGVIAVLGLGVTLTMRASVRRAEATEDADEVPVPESGGIGKVALAFVLVSFTALQASNAAAVSVMALFTTESLGLPIAWSGVALGVSAAIEIPALLLVGRLSRRFSSLRILAVGCVVGGGYYAIMAAASGVVVLLAAQVLNAVFFAVVAGIGLTYFQEIIPKPGLASGLFSNTRSVGSVVSGGLIALGPALFGGYRGVFVLCAALAVVALAALGVSQAAGRR